MKLAWGAKLTPEQRAFVVSMASALGTDPSRLTSVIQFESRWNPQAVNAKSGATGLIQFMPATAIGLGTTVEAIAQLDIDGQLPLCYAYWKPYAGRMKTLSDCYMAVLWPPAIGQPENAIIFQPGSKAFLQNAGLDIDHDGAVTKAEAAAFVQRAYDQGMQDGNAAEVSGDTFAGEQVITQPEEPAMAAPDVGGIVSLFNPVVGGLISILSPILQGKLAQVLSKETDPAQAAQIASDFSKTLLGQARVLTGQPNEFQAVASIAADPAQAENKAKLEASLTADLDARLAKAGDKATQWDQALWEAQNKGRQTVSTIAIEEHRAGIWDMTRTIVYTTCLVLIAISVGLLLLIGKQAWGDPGKIDSGLIGLAGPIWMGTIASAFMAMVAYRFDGNKQQSEQSKRLLNATKEVP